MNPAAWSLLGWVLLVAAVVWVCLGVVGVPDCTVDAQWQC